MADFINTIDVLGDDAVIDSIIQKTITEFNDNVITTVGKYAFTNCTALQSVDLPAVKSIEEYAFDNCKELTSVNFPAVTSIGQYALQLVPVIRLCMPSLKQTAGNCFRAMGNLVTLDLPVCEKIVGWLAYQCNNLSYVVLRNNAVCTLNSNECFMTYVGTPHNEVIKIFVPAALLEDYKVATNWTVYADQLYALENYTVDGTITGDLDETKI